MADAKIRGGYYIVPRRRRRHPLWKAMTVEQRAVMDECVARANWTDGRMWAGSTMIPVPRGSFVATQQQIADEAKVSRKTVRTALIMMEHAEFISRREVRNAAGHRMGQGSTVVTIENYDYYQDFANYEGHPGATHLPTHLPTQAHNTILSKVRKEETCDELDYFSPIFNSPRNGSPHSPICESSGLRDVEGSLSPRTPPLGAHVMDDDAHVMDDAHVVDDDADHHS